MKDILIIGGSYFAGRVLLEKLIQEKDYNIYIYNRGNVRLNWKEVTELVGDRDNEERMKQVIPDKEWDAVIDFCAYAPQHIEKVVRSVPGKLNHYIFISTTSVYQDIHDLPIKENAPKLTAIQPELGPYADYGFNKWQSECKLQEECEKRGIHFTSLRPAIIYGRYNYAPRESYFFDLLRDNKPVIIPENELPLFSFVWVVDVARLIIKCIGNDKVFDQAFNISSDDLISYRRLTEVLGEISGKKPDIQSMSIDEINEKRIPLPFPLDSHLVYSGALIKRVLDFEYTPFLEGMRGTYKYYLMVQEKMKEKKEKQGV